MQDTTVKTAADTRLTRECERIRAAERAGEIPKREAASQIEAAHARRDASLRGAGHTQCDQGVTLGHAGCIT
jgi:hypothetical protein